MGARLPRASNAGPHSPRSRTSPKTVTRRGRAYQPWPYGLRRCLSCVTAAMLAAFKAENDDELRRLLRLVPGTFLRWTLPQMNPACTPQARRGRKAGRRRWRCAKRWSRQPANKPMSALPPKADMCSATRHVRFVPIADMPPFIRSPRRRVRGRPRDPPLPKKIHYTPPTSRITTALIREE
jgi:hypothetical protein